VFAERTHNLIGTFVFNTESDDATLGDAAISYDNTGKWAQLCAQLIGQTFNAPPGNIHVPL